ncbi:MAG: formate/nitrite transporter family protein [Clostridia bacterium]|nr:formate/nitrite transporter family protein [Clostridia bacterium]
MKTALRQTAFRSVAAGLLIGLGGSVYLACRADRYLAAVFFTVALLSICYLGAHLYTGRVGGLVAEHRGADILSLAVCLLGNLVGTGVCAALAFASSRSLHDAARLLVEPKLQRPLWSVLAAAVLCGVLMYIAVTVYRTKNSPLGILFCVPVFILAGFEHSIADMFYVWLSGLLGWRSWLFLAVVVVGNSIGGCLLPLLFSLGETPKKPQTDANPHPKDDENAPPA